jgi:hypothetical protein
LVYFQDRDAEEPALETLSGASAGIGAMSWSPKVGLKLPRRRCHVEVSLG